MEEQHYDALLTSSSDIRCVGLRTLLEEEPLVKFIGQVEVPALTRELPRRSPDVVLLVCGPDEKMSLGTAREIRVAAPQSKLLAIGETVNYALEMALIRLGIAAFVLWDDVNAHSLHWLLGAVLKGRWRVASPQAVDEIALPPSRRHLFRLEARLTERDWRILRGLARGLSEREIAEAERVGARTIERRIPALEDLFEAATLYELRVKARDLNWD